MRWMIGMLIVLLLALQYRLWVGDGGFRQVRQLQRSVDVQRVENDRLLERNRALDAEVRDLKGGVAAVEERARSELGMIGRDETFYQIVRKREPREGAE